MSILNSQHSGTSVSQVKQFPDGRRLYKAGFDPGSGYSELFIAPVDDPEQVRYAIIPSWVSSGTLEEIGRRSALLTSDPAEQLAEDEFVIGINGEEYYVGRLGQTAGKSRTNALNDQRRYTNEHALSLLLALCGYLVPEHRFALQYVTALPVSLYNDEERRHEIQDSFTREFQFQWNGETKNGLFTCGAVVPEGAGGLMLYGDTSSRTLLVDYGYRTTDVLTADGQKVDFDRSGGFPIGVGSIVDAFNEEFYTLAGRRLREDEADELLRAYVNGDAFPLIKSSRKRVDPEKIRTILDRVYEQVGKQANTQIAQIVNQDEHAEIGADYDIVLPVGGGAPHFRRMLETMISNVEVIEDPQNANPEGYLAIANAFGSQIWAKVVNDVVKRRGNEQYA
jgi:hypothetical protein